MAVAIILCSVMAAVALRGLWRPGYTIALGLCLAAFDQLLAAKSALFAAHLSWPNFAVASAACAALVGVVWRSPGPARRGLHSVEALVWLYLALFVSTVYLVPFVTPQEVLAAVAPLLLLNVVLLPRLLQDARDGRDAVEVGFWICGVATLYVLLDPSSWSSDTRRLSLAVLGREDMSSNPLALGDIGATAIMCGILRPSFGGLDWRAWVSYLACATGLLVTARAARGETLAAVVAGTVVFLLARSEKTSFLRKPVGMLVLAAVVGLAIAVLLDSRFALRYQSFAMTSGVEERFLRVMALLRQFGDSPANWLFGLGGGYATVRFGSYPHNQLVQALAETGLVGLGLWLAIPAVAFLSVRRNWHLANQSPATRSALLILVAMSLYHLLVGFKRGRVINPPYFALVILLERYCWSLRSREQSRELPEGESPRSKEHSRRLQGGDGAPATLVSEPQ